MTQPTPEEIDNCVIEEATAMNEFAKASKAETNATLKVQAARKRLMLARAAKSAIVRDLIAFSN